MSFLWLEKLLNVNLSKQNNDFQLGLTAITDIHEAQAEYDNALTAEIRAQNTLYNAEEGLREKITNYYPRDIHVLNTKRFSASLLTRQCQ